MQLGGEDEASQFVDWVAKKARGHAQISTNMHITEYFVAYPGPFGSEKHLSIDEMYFTERCSDKQKMRGRLHGDCVYLVHWGCRRRL